MEDALLPVRLHRVGEMLPLAAAAAAEYRAGWQAPLRRGAEQIDQFGLSKLPALAGHPTADAVSRRRARDKDSLAKVAAEAATT
jgi:hypothetical protein